ncbi:MAG: efflux RND transporter periplasmic adaptor subunit [Candidatus Obscuribacterales bacterium]|nr:efflux RND transporter periplasmic adaptor subunit [Candidatus Obscuribacterales bacterium]
MQTNRRPETQSENQFQLPAWPGRNRFVVPAVAAVILIAAIGGCIAVFSGNKGTNIEATVVATPPVLTVNIERAIVRPVNQQIRVTGSVWARDPLVIACEANGLQIQQVLVDEGHQVKKGQPLAILNGSILRAELEREKALLASSEASLQKSYQPNRREDINGLRAAVAQARANAAQQHAVRVQAEANLANARNNAKRYSDLLVQGAVSAQEAESKDTTERVAQAELKNSDEKIRAADFILKQAEERLSMAVSGGRLEDVQIARAEVNKSRANVHRLEALLAQTVVRAPSDGLITRRDAHIGDSSTSGKSLFTMIRDNQIEMRAQVPEKDLSVLHAGLPVIISSASLGSKTITGRIREIGSHVDPDTRLCTVKIDVDFKSGLKPGMFAEGRVNLENFTALTVSSSAVISRDDKYFVFVFEKLPQSPAATPQASSASAVKPMTNGIARLHYVLPGARTGNYTEIREGLKDGDEVVTSGAGFIKDGDTVSVGQ